MGNQERAVESLKLLYDKLDQLRYQKSNTRHTVRSALYFEQVYKFYGYPKQPETIAQLFEQFLEIRKYSGYLSDFSVEHKCSLSQPWIKRVNDLFLCSTEKILYTPLRYKQTSKKEWIFKDGSAYVYDVSDDLR